MVGRFVHRRWRVNDKFPRSKFNDINAKHKQKSAILAVWDTAYDKF
jgi:hypothetical protein